MVLFEAVKTVPNVVREFLKLITAFSDPSKRKLEFSI